MAYNIIKPEVTDLRAATWRAMKGQWQFWVVMVGSIGFAVWLYPFLMTIWVVLIPTSAFFAYFGSVYAKFHSAFWRDIAALNHWTYTPRVLEIPHEGVIFERGYARQIEHHISGVIDNDRNFELFQYSFMTGSSKDRQTHNFFIITFTFEGNFPHIYLNSKYDLYGVSDGEKLPLPSEFEKKFSLHAPRKYEIEALAIFTPDVLAKLLEKDVVFDVEFVGQKILICIAGVFDGIEGLEFALRTGLEIEDLFDDKLDTFKFHKIGNMPYHLK